MPRALKARKVTLQDEASGTDLQPWAEVSPDERFADTWRLSLELWTLSGRMAEPEVNNRSVVKIIRPR